MWPTSGGKPGDSNTEPGARGIPKKRRGIVHSLRDSREASGFTCEELPAGSFSNAGTNVNTLLITYSEPKLAPAPAPKLEATGQYAMF
jgi:hypothetical protein